MPVSTDYVSATSFAPVEAFRMCVQAERYSVRQTWHCAVSLTNRILSGSYLADLLQTLLSLRRKGRRHGRRAPERAYSQGRPPESTFTVLSYAFPRASQSLQCLLTFGSQLLPAVTSAAARAACDPVVRIPNLVVTRLHSSTQLSKRSYLPDIAGGTIVNCLHRWFGRVQQQCGVSSKTGRAS